MPEGKSEKREGRSGRTDLMHGIYRIIAGRQADAGHAIAYLGNRRIHVATKGSVESAIAAATAALDLRIQKLRSLRQGDVPSTEEFLEGLQALDARTYFASAPLLRVHRHRPMQSTTIAKIAHAVGLSENAATAVYVKLGKAIGSALDLAPAADGLGRRLSPLLVFAIVESGDKGQLVLQLRPAFVGALDAAPGVLRRSAA